MRFAQAKRFMLGMLKSVLPKKVYSFVRNKTVRLVENGYNYYVIMVRRLKVKRGVAKNIGARNNDSNGHIYNYELLENIQSHDYLMETTNVEGISIIVLNRNGGLLLNEFFKGLSHLPNLPCELIVVDHCSSDSSLNIVDSFKKKNENIEVRVIKKVTNDLYSISNNDAIKLSKYNYILLINNDVILTHYSNIRKALYLLLSQPNIGVIGWDLYYEKECEFPQHRGISFFWDHVVGFQRPKNIVSRQYEGEVGDVFGFPAVTAALALFRKNDLLAIGGFDEKYNYGFEDVDLCLRLNTLLNKKSVIINGLSAIHVESVSQSKDSRLDVSLRRKNNAQHFKQKFGFQLNNFNRRFLLSDHNLFTLNAKTIAFVVTEVGDSAVAGDYFTALEFSIAMEESLNCNVKFLPQRGVGSESSHDCSGVDMLIVMIDRFDIRKLVNRSPTMEVVAWMRNWFDRWTTWSWFLEYDHYFASSFFAKKYLLSSKGISSEVLRIGTNSDRFFCQADNFVREIDVVFTGSYWNVKREIEDAFDIMKGYNSRVYGAGWGSHEEIGSLYYGLLRYDQIPDLYSSTKIVIDDAASSTKKWCSVNSRVYDALAAGCLVISNSHGAVEELGVEFKLPTYNTLSELDELLKIYLTDEGARMDKCKSLQTSILSHHSYKARASEFIATINSNIERMMRISIKIPVPNVKAKESWGDFHFAESLKAALKKQGHTVRIDFLSDWYCSMANGDEVVIVLRGLKEYKPNEGQINVMWNISHPDKVNISEYENYDVVFVSSQKHSNYLSEALTKTSVYSLLQCTDENRFYQSRSSEIRSHELLFVGNSRNIFREVVKFSIENKLPISVYGGKWNQFIDDKYIKKEVVLNTQLKEYYSNSKIVLNDHWESMRVNGFISNRIFDVVACGGMVVSDDVEGIKDIFGESVEIYDGTEVGFLRAVKLARVKRPSEETINSIRSNHTFSKRVDTILEVITPIYKDKFIVNGIGR